MGCMMSQEEIKKLLEPVEDDSCYTEEVKRKWEKELAMRQRRVVRIRFWGKDKERKEQKALTLMRDNGIIDGYCVGLGWIYFKDSNTMMNSVELLDEAGINYTIGNRFRCDRELECKKKLRKEGFDWDNATKEEMREYLIRKGHFDDPIFPVDDLSLFTFDGTESKEKAVSLLKENGLHIVLEDEISIVLNDVAPSCNHCVGDYWLASDILEEANCEVKNSNFQLWIVDAVWLIERDRWKTYSSKESKKYEDELKKQLERARFCVERLEEWKQLSMNSSI